MLQRMHWQVATRSITSSSTWERIPGLPFPLQGCLLETCCKRAAGQLPTLALCLLGCIYSSCSGLPCSAAEHPGQEASHQPLCLLCKSSGLPVVHLCGQCQERTAETVLSEGCGSPCLQSGCLRCKALG